MLLSDLDMDHRLIRTQAPRSGWTSGCSHNTFVLIEEHCCAFGSWAKVASSLSVYDRRNSHSFSHGGVAQEKI